MSKKILSLEEYHDQKRLKEENWEFYYFSKHPATIDYVNQRYRDKKRQERGNGFLQSAKNKEDLPEVRDMLRDHGINRHTIVLSVKELTNDNFSLNMNLGTWMKYLRIYDPSVIIIN